MRFLLSLCRTDAGPAVIVIRFLVGWVFVVEGIGKFIYAADQGAGRFAKIPAIPTPEFFGPFVGAVEIVFGLLVLLGFFTRVAALVLLTNISVALLSTKLPILWGEHYGLPALKRYNLWSMLHESRTDGSMWLGCLFLIAVGGGKWSVDARVWNRDSQPAALPQGTL